MNGYVTSHVRYLNRLAVYKTIKEKGVTSKAEISRLTGISVPTVIKIISFLMQKKLVIEQGGTRSVYAASQNAEPQFGRKPCMLTLNRSLMYVISFFLEGDYLSMGVVDITNKVIFHKTIRLPSNITFILQTITDRLVDEIMAEAALDPERLIGIGIALPCIYDKYRYMVIKSPLIGVEDTLFIGNTLSLLTKKYGVSVEVENDANAQALGEYHCVGVSQGDSLIFISVGTGVGAGLIFHDVLRRGYNSMCGEIGHFLPMDGQTHTGKNGGWLENHINYRMLERKFGVSFDSPISECPNADIPALIEYVAVPLAAAIHNITALLDCPNIILGGVVVNALGDRLIASVKEKLNAVSINETYLRKQSDTDIGIMGISVLIIDKHITEILLEESD